MIGRDTEAELLADAFKRVAAGEGREIVLISGEAGIGKTTLATQAARAAFEAGAIVLLGRCDEDLGVPYGPFVEALSHYVTHASEEALRAHMCSLWVRSWPRWSPPSDNGWGSCPRPRAPTPTPSATSSTTPWSDCSARCLTDKPLVLVLDDLQWADKPSLQLLRHVVANTTAIAPAHRGHLSPLGALEHPPIDRGPGRAPTRDRSEPHRALRPG